MNWNLHDHKIHRFRQKQDLNVKGKPIDLCALKNLECGMRPEAFEPALCVQKLESGQARTNRLNVLPINSRIGL